MIPKIFHRIWLGPRQMPAEHVAFGEGWIKNHPGWQMKLWRDADLFPLINQKYFDNAGTFATKSDLLRFEIIYNFGGVYLDVDMESFKNIEPLLQGVRAWTAYETPGQIGFSTFGAEPKTKWMLDMIASVKEIYGNGIVKPPMTKFFGKVTERHKKDVRIFEHGLFYPYSYREKDRKGEAFPDAYAAHHWAQNWGKVNSRKGPKVFGVGLSRTGTTTLTEALYTLGYKSVHCPLDLRTLDLFDAATDVPIALNYKGLDLKYPGSKFILTVRGNMEAWLDSEKWLHDRYPLEEKIEKHQRMIEERRLKLYGSVGFDRAKYAEGHRRHIEDVMAYFKDRPGDFLVMDITEGDGWEKLCPFLGKKIPDQPFPHLNKRGVVFST